MTFEEFTGQVQNLAQLGTEGQAVEATRAVLVTLGERLKGDEPLDLASELPVAIKEFLTDSTGSGTGEPFSSNEFVRRVAHRANTNEQQARLFTQAVFQVLGQSITAGQWRDMLGQLPNEYSSLFEQVEPPAAMKKRQTKRQSTPTAEQPAATGRQATTTGRQSLRTRQPVEQQAQPLPQIDQPQPVEPGTPWQPTTEWQQTDTGVF